MLDLHFMTAILLILLLNGVWANNRQSLLSCQRTTRDLEGIGKPVSCHQKNASVEEVISSLRLQLLIQETPHRRIIQYLQKLGYTLRMLVSGISLSDSRNANESQLFSVTGQTNTSPGRNTKVRQPVALESMKLTVPGLPIISVCPVKRPKLNGSGKKYSFQDEKELMKDKLRTALRIAVYYGYPNICIGTFGLGSGFGNPPEEVAIMWRDLFLKDPEFVGHFNDVVFAFEPPEGPLGASSSSSSSSKSSSKHSSSSSSSRSSVSSALDIFKHAFKPSVIHEAYKGSKSYSSSSSSNW